MKHLHGRYVFQTFAEKHLSQELLCISTRRLKSWKTPREQSARYERWSNEKAIENRAEAVKRSRGLLLAGSRFALEQHRGLLRSEANNALKSPRFARFPLHGELRQ